MIRWLLKYGLGFFLANTILFAIEYTRSLAQVLFLVFMFLFSLLLFNSQRIKDVIFHKAFSFFLILNIINILYWLFFHSFSDQLDGGKYLLARGIQFSIISFSVYYNFEYYKTRFLEHLAYVIFSMICIGLIINLDLFIGRYAGIIWNPNQLASFSVIAFAALFFSAKKRTNFDYVVLFGLFVISLATGSRSILVGIPLVFLIKFGISLRNVIYTILAIIFYAFLINIQLDTSINRFAEQTLLNDRLLQYKYAYETLIEKPFLGYGLDKYAYIDPLVVPNYIRGTIIGAHNGYLAILVQYGILFGSLVLGIIFRKIFLLFNQGVFRNPEYKFYVYIIIYTLISAIYESLITGINEFHTILFWMSLAILSFSIFNKKYAY